MNSSCEIPAPEKLGHAVTSSRVHRFQPGHSPLDPHSWSGIATIDYKAAAAHHCGVTRTVLSGESGEKTAFHVRYFEIAPRGNTTLERHQHEHVVVVLRGSGQARLGDRVEHLHFGDTLYVAPGEVHQLTNSSESEIFGFLCIVDAQRDKPIVVSEDANCGL